MTVILYFFPSGLATGFFEILFCAENFTYHNWHKHSRAVYWITVPFALVPASLSALTLAYGQTRCISCGLGAGSSWELGVLVGVLVAGCFGWSLLFLNISRFPSLLCTASWLPWFGTWGLSIFQARQQSRSFEPKGLLSRELGSSTAPELKASRLSA